MRPSTSLYVIDRHGVVTLCGESVEHFAAEMDLPAGELVALFDRLTVVGGAEWPVQ